LAIGYLRIAFPTRSIHATFLLVIGNLNIFEFFIVTLMRVLHNKYIHGLLTKLL
jgi:hypothetical protein